RNWWLTSRDRYANNIGFSLRPRRPDPEVDLPEATIDTSPGCSAEASGLVAVERPVSDLERGFREGFFERMGYGAVGRWGGRGAGGRPPRPPCNGTRQPRATTGSTSSVVSALRRPPGISIGTRER